MEEVIVPASTEKLQPIFCNHVRMSLGTNGLVYFDFRTVLPDFSAAGKSEAELEGKKIRVDLKEDLTSPHTRIVMPLDAAVALRQMLSNSIEVLETPDEPAG